jgi:hypothetical protein
MQPSYGKIGNFDQTLPPYDFFFLTLKSICLSILFYKVVDTTQSYATPLMTMNVGMNQNYFESLHLIIESMLR